jgi:hypothetical protein
MQCCSGSDKSEKPGGIKFNSQEGGGDKVPIWKALHPKPFTKVKILYNILA